MLNLAIHPRGRLSAVAVRLALAVLVIVALLQLRFYLPRGGLPRRPPGGPPHHHPEWNWNPDKEETHGSETQDVCAPFTGLERVVITVKTGATEAAKRIPTLLQTSLRCAPHVLVFSDMAQKLGDIEIYDSLDETAAAIKDGNRDFDLYRKQQEIQDPERIATELKTMHSPEDPEDLAAWVLDKYKNTHIVEKSWALKPDMDWYLHIDADSYVVWPSLIEWIKKLDPTEEAFYGSMSYLNDVSFAHGGSGILITGAASRNFAVTHNGTAARWDPQIPNKCCGDYVLAQALLENGVGLVKHSWPTINGESQSTIPFDEEHWCRPLVTMHHVSPEEAIEMGQFEDRRPDKSQPITYQELFVKLQLHEFPDYQKHWNNLAEGETIEDVESGEACFRACASNEECFQALYDGSECNLGTESFQIGSQQLPMDGKTWESSWNTTRISEWVKKQKPCGDLDFPWT